jgi:hypothetical protein
MKFTLFQKIKFLKFERYLFLNSFEIAFLGDNFGKPNPLKNKEFLRIELEGSLHNNANFLSTLLCFWHLKAFFEDSQV